MSGEKIRIYKKVFRGTFILPTLNGLKFKQYRRLYQQTPDKAIARHNRLNTRHKTTLVKTVNLSYNNDIEKERSS